MANILLYVEPGHKRTESNIVYFQDELKNNPDRYDQTIEDNRDTSKEHSRYEELCRRPDSIVSFQNSPKYVLMIICIQFYLL